MSQRPVVDIEFRGWSPYARSKQQVNGKTAPSSSAPTSASSTTASASTSALTLPTGDSYRRSSSPVFVSANKVATSSKSLVNGLSSKSIQNGLSNGALVARKTEHIVVDVYSNRLLPYEPAHFNRRDRNSHEEVCPPKDEPRLRSIFDDSPSGWGASIWSPSHRIAKTAEADTCQWIVLDEGFGEIERCEKVFTTTESLAKHVLFAHCSPPRPAAFNAPAQLLSCAWGACKYKRFPSSLLKEHVLEHLRPLAFVCPFQACRMSVSSQMASAETLDAHIQTYHINDETLRPLGTPKSLKSLLAKHPLPLLPKKAPQWLANNQRLPIPPRLIGLLREPRRKVVDDPPEPLPPGGVWPWDLVWTELNKLEPPAIPVSPATLATLIPSQEPPTIRIIEIPPAIELPVQPTPHLQVEIDIPPRQKPMTEYIDLTNDDIELYPTPPSPKYRPAVDMTAASLAKRDAKRDYHRNRLRSLAGNDSSSQTYTDESSQEMDDDSLHPPEPKRIKLEADRYGENQMPSSQ